MDKAIEIDEKLFEDWFETFQKKDGMQNFLNKSKKVKKTKNNKKKDSNQITELPKGKLKPADIFSKNMVLLTKDFTIHPMPEI